LSSKDRARSEKRRRLAFESLTRERSLVETGKGIMHHDKPKRPTYFRVSSLLFYIDSMFWKKFQQSFLLLLV
jgi:hypothetical protein